MLDTLLESRAKTRHPIAGTLLSVSVHTTRIPDPVLKDDATPVYFVRPNPPSPRSERSTESASPGLRSRERPILRFFDVPVIDVDVPALQLPEATTRPDDFGTGHTAVADSAGSRSSGAPGSSSAFRSDEVEKQVALRPGNARPVYPLVLANTGVGGKVIATFVVNQLGQAEDSTVRFGSSDNRLFDDAVRAALRRMRFIPAETGGVKVRQLVQMPFVFTLQK